MAENIPCTFFGKTFTSAAQEVRKAFQRACADFRCQELQKLLGVEIIEKATLLKQAADYTRQLQVCALQSYRQSVAILSWSSTPIVLHHEVIVVQVQEYKQASCSGVAR